MTDVRLGERVLSVDEEGHLTYSEVIAFLDRDEGQRGYFQTLTTDRGHSITLTAKHLIYVTHSNVTADYDVTKSSDGGADLSRFGTLFAEEVRVGQVIMVIEDDPAKQRGSSTGRRVMTPARVTHVQPAVQTGVYAPLTKTGTIVVDGVVASCYAVMNNPSLAHAVFAPMRGWHELSARLRWLSSLFSTSSSSSSGNNEVGHSLPQRGVHLYAKLLYELGAVLLSRDVLYVP